MFKKIKYTFLILFAIAQIANAQLPPLRPEYQLVFSDEFDTTYATIIDTSKWQRIPEWNQHSNLTGSMSYCIPGADTIWDRAYIIMDNHDSSTVKVSSGTCKLLTNRINYNGEVWSWLPCDSLNDSTLTGLPCMDDCQFYGSDTIPRCFRADTIPFKYTTGMLYSRDRFKYGYFEINFKLPHVPSSPNTYQGFGPNFWLFRSDNTVGNYWSEIDIFEINAYRSSGSHIDSLSCNVHYSNKDSSWHPSNGLQYGNIQANVWHKAAGWWTPEFVKIYLDDSLIHTVQNDPLIPVDSLVPMYMFVDINSPATNYCTNFDTVNTQFPYIYEVDYIRVYQLNQDCDTNKIYCNVTASTFESGLYKTLTVGGTGCNAVFDSYANVTGLGNDYVLLSEGVSFDNTSSGYFDVTSCDENQYFQRISQNKQPPPNAWVRKFHYK